MLLVSLSIISNVSGLRGEGCAGVPRAAILYLCKSLDMFVHNELILIEGCKINSRGSILSSYHMFIILCYTKSITIMT